MLKGGRFGVAAVREPDPRQQGLKRRGRDVGVRPDRVSESQIHDNKDW